MLMSYLSDLATVRSAGGKGDGIFAIDSIPAGETVAVFGGHICHRAELDALPERRRSHSIQIDENLYMVGSVTDEPADFVNHSCEPNAGLCGNVLVKAMHDIAPGEEICIDYAMCDADDYDEFVCACGTAGCRGIIAGNDWQRPELQLRYAGWFSSYIDRKIAKHSEAS
jgi:SET domain-containing protein